MDTLTDITADTPDTASGASVDTSAPPVDSAPIDPILLHGTENVSDQDSAAAADRAADAPPLPTDAAPPNSGSDTSQEQQADDSTASGEKAKDTDTEDAPLVDEMGAYKNDPNLSQEENETIRSLPHAEWGNARRAFKAAKTEAKFLNPEYAAGELVNLFDTKNAERSRELQTAYVLKAASDADGLIRTVNDAGGKETYGNLATAVFRADPDYFAQESVGDETATAEVVKEAYDFWKANRDRADLTADGSAESAEGVFQELETFYPDLIEEMGEDYPEMLDRLKNALTRTAAAAKPDAAATTGDESTKVEGEAKPDDAARTAELEALRTSQTLWQTNFDGLLSHATARADKTFGTEVTENERKLAPEVAYLKDQKHDLMMHGNSRAGIPDFEQGFVEWGKENAEFNATLKEFGEAVYVARDAQAAEAARQKLQPYIDRYMDVRAKLPAVEMLTREIAARAQRHTQTPHREKFIPASGGSESRQRPTPARGSNEALDQIVIDAALNAG